MKKSFFNSIVGMFALSIVAFINKEPIVEKEFIFYDFFYCYNL